MVILRSLSFLNGNEEATDAVGNTAAGSISMGIKDFPDNPNFRKNSVHDKRHPGHVTAGIQERKKNIFSTSIWGTKAKHSAHASHNII